ITLDGKEVSAPVIQTVFTSGSGIIEGNFTTKSANELAIQLKSGSLPVPLEVIQSSRVEPTLGRDSVNRSLVAGAIGLLLVAFFMIAYYRLPGAIAVLALLYYTALTVTQMLLHAAIEASSLRRRRLYGVEEKAPDARAAGAPVVAV